MKTIDSYLSELPEPERTLCLEARAKAKKRRPYYQGMVTWAKRSEFRILDPNT